MSNSTESSTPDETEESPVVESLLQFELPTPEVDGSSEPGSGDIRRSFILTFHTDTSDDTKNQAIFDEHISRDVPAGDS
ncbi:hypothetical protein BV898_15299 [Hypsibius exemplaris]|uniref:Uncharacterized protein n=1 Tax=Hypsibius exemplaris TaxID=2072580 RepID=A0A9X6NAL6_HYPEX|nr:hypothetical protein BV898_15299 [Hypsibius exemplaris]